MCHKNDRRRRVNDDSNEIGSRKIRAARFHFLLNVISPFYKGTHSYVIWNTVWWVAQLKYSYNFVCLMYSASATVFDRPQNAGRIWRCNVYNNLRKSVKINQKIKGHECSFVGEHISWRLRGTYWTVLSCVCDFAKKKLGLVSHWISYNIIISMSFLEIFQACSHCSCGIKWLPNHQSQIWCFLVLTTACEVWWYVVRFP